MGVDSILNKIKGKFDSDNTMSLDEIDAFEDPSSWIPTGVPRLDFKLQTLGFPRGIIEIAGVSMSGKTTLALHVLKEFLQKNKKNGFAVILSSERRDNKEYAEMIGINPRKVLVVYSKFVEDLLLKAQSMITNIQKMWEEDEEEGNPKFLFLWDSLGSTLSRAEVKTMEKNQEKMEKAQAKGGKYEIDHEQMGAFAKQAKKLAKFMLAHSHENDTCFVIINHVMDKIGQVGTKSPGGKWVEFLPTIRLKLAKISSIKSNKDADEIIGQVTKIEILKSDYGTKHKFDVEMLLGYGFILGEDDIDFAIAEEIVDAPSSKVREALGGKLRWKSRPEFYNLYKDGKTRPLMKVLEKKIMKAYHKSVLDSKNK